MKNSDFIPATIFQKFKALSFLLFLLIFILPLTAQITVSGSNTKDGSYTSLTNASGAFAALNSVTQAGRTITITITSDVTTEAGTNMLTGAAGMWTSLTISPSGNRTISGTVSNKPMIDLNGADYVIIDGLNNGTNSLAISNFSTVSTGFGTSTIRFKNDAQNNTIKNCTISGSNGGLGSADYAATILFNTALVTTGTGNDNNIIEYNNITNAGGVRPVTVIFSAGSASQENSGNIIRYNKFYDFFNPGLSSNCISISAYNIDWTIQGNSFYETTASPGFTITSNNLSYIVINVMSNFVNGCLISGNYIGGNAANCSGTWLKNGSFDASFYAINAKITAAVGKTCSIQGNTITGIDWENNNASNTSAVYFTAISTSNGTADYDIGSVTGNTIGAATGSGAITFSGYYSGAGAGLTSTFWGITAPNGSAGTITIKNNIIGSVTAANSNTANGINVYAIYRFGGTNPTTIENNTIGSTDAGTTYSINASSTATANTQQVWGIKCDATGTTSIQNNIISKINNGSTNTATGTANYAIGIITTGGTNTISNNIVRDLSCGSGTTEIAYQNSVVGIAQYSSTAAAQTVTGNTIYNLSNSYASFTGYVVGIWYTGSTTVSNVSKNFIRGLSASSTAAGVYGIRIAGGATNYSNNIISLGGTAITPLYGVFYGIYETGSAGNNNSLYYNTVYVGGTPTSGTLKNSYALYSAVNTNTRDFRNNIFCNARSNSGTATGSHFAMYIVTAGGTLTCNYNDYNASGTGGILGYYAANKTVLPIATAQDANSLSTNPLFASAGGTLAADYFVSAALPAITGTGITTDYNGNARSLTPRMGVWEVNGTLAVSLLSFTGIATGNTAVLQWTTASETDHHYFELQRSQDGISFSTIATISGLGNSSNGHLYSYSDMQPLSSINYYRLKQVDNNGRITYSAIISIINGKDNQQLTAFPNPVTNGVLHISLQAAAVVKCYNSMGLLVFTKYIGAGTHSIDVNKFSKGIYFLSANAKSTMIVIR